MMADDRSTTRPADPAKHRKAVAGVRVEMVTSGLKWSSAFHLASEVDKVRGTREGSRVRAVKYGIASMSLSAIAARPEFACTHPALVSPPRLKWRATSACRAHRPPESDRRQRVCDFRLRVRLRSPVNPAATESTRG